MEQIHATIEAARDHRGALMNDCLRRAWTALTQVAHEAHARNSSPRTASNSVANGPR
jgi:hypothetical protein